MICDTNSNVKSRDAALRNLILTLTVINKILNSNGIFYFSLKKKILGRRTVYGRHELLLCNFALIFKVCNEVILFYLIVCLFIHIISRH